MANRVKSVSKYSGSAWGTEVPIGADATNVDMTTAPSDYDSSSSETSKVLIGTNDVKVIASDTDLTAWGKFNRFRRRVSNKFADYFATANLTGSSAGVTSSGDDSHAYTTAALNNYFNTVIGYQSAADVSTVGSVASQLSSLNDKILIGQIICYGSSTVPSKWLLCNGQAISRTTYNKLFGIISTIYGSGNGSTTFNVPDLRGRTAIGSGTGTASDATAHNLGDMNGEEKHQITVAELASHSHNLWQRPKYNMNGGGDGLVNYQVSGSSLAGPGYTGGNQPHNNMQPYTTINYIIYTGV